MAEPSDPRSSGPGEMRRASQKNLRCLVSCLDTATVLHLARADMSSGTGRPISQRRILLLGRAVRIRSEDSVAGKETYSGTIRGRLDDVAGAIAETLRSDDVLHSLTP